MKATVIHGDEGEVLGIHLQHDDSEDTGVLQKFNKEGMVPVQYEADGGLVVGFGQPAPATDPEGETESFERIDTGDWAG